MIHRKGLTAREIIIPLYVLSVIGLVMLFSGPSILGEAKAGKFINNDVQIYDGTVTMINGETHNMVIAPTGVAYIKVMDRVNQTIYDSVLQKMVPKASAVWADSEVLMVDETLTWGGWLYVIPTLLDGSDLKVGWYDVIVYDRVTATPLTTDPILNGSRTCYIHNGIMISFNAI